MKVLFFICFCLVLPLNGRQLGNDVSLNFSSVYNTQNSRHAPEGKQQSKIKSETSVYVNKPMDRNLTSEAPGEARSFISLFRYFMEPEFAGILVFVVIVGMSGMKHTD